MDPITAGINLVSTVLSFIPRKSGEGTDYTELTALERSRLTELEREELSAKQTTTIIYSVLGFIVLIVLVFVGIKVFKNVKSS